MTAVSYRIADVITAMETWAPPAYAYDWDRIGLSTGAPGGTVSRVLCCLSVTEEVFKQALAWGAEMVVSHHPLIWEPLRSLREDHVHTRLCLDFARSNIACFSAHTNLDLAPGGVNDVLAAQLGLRDPQPLIAVKQASLVKLVTFVPESHLRLLRDALAAAGAGVIGNYSHCSFSAPGTGTFLPGVASTPFLGQRGVVNEEPEVRLEMVVPKARLSQVLEALRSVHPYEEPAYDLVVLENREHLGLGRYGLLEHPQALGAFAAEISRRLGCASLRLAGPAGRAVQKIGVIGGSGGDYVQEVASKVDVLVTGDVKYHQALDAIEAGLCIVDAGHGATERPIVCAMAEYLTGALPGLEAQALREEEVFRTVVEREDA